MADRWTPETPWFGPNKKTQAVWPTWTCRNPNCKSYGKSHPNCRCGAPSFSQQSKNLEYAHGGEVRFCHSCEPHQKDCEFYAEGGDVVPQTSVPLPSTQNDDPSATLGHAAIEHGLNGILGGSLGSPLMRDPEKHKKVLDEAKASHRFNGLEDPEDGLQEGAPKRTLGTRLGEHIFKGEHDKSTEAMKDHPLVGSVGKETLKPILERLAGPTLQMDSNPEAFRGSVDYLASSARGAKKLDEEMKDLFGPKKIPTHLQEMSREAERNELKEKLDNFQVNPKELLDIGGSLGHYLPEHAGHMGATAAQALNYFSSLKPKVHQSGPLDPVSSPNPLEEDMYHRQLDLANQPLIALEHIRNGMVHPQDMTTLKTIYPGLHQSMVSKLGEALIHAKSEGQEISYPHRLALSQALGQPLDGTMTAASMQAIIASAGGSSAPSGAPKKSHGVTAQTQKTLEKTDALYETPLEQRQINHKD